MQIMGQWAGLITGGILGTILRYLISGAVAKMAGPRYPFGTMTVNLIGCLLVGIFAGLGAQKITLAPETRLLLITGFCGAFTTFSALILETASLVKSEGLLIAALNIFAQIVLGYILFRAGMAAAELF